MLRQCFRAVRIAHREEAALLVTHGPQVAVRCGALMRTMGVGVPLMAWAFHYAVPPTGKKASLVGLGIRRADLVVSFSTAEMELYRRLYRIQRHRLAMVYWGTASPPPSSADEARVELGDYAAAIGGSSRDYATLFAAAEQLPQVRIVVVARPENLSGLAVPANVAVHTNIPYDRMQNILRHARLSVVPLFEGAKSGHGLMLQSWQLRRPLVVTDVPGVSDYLRTGENALSALPGDAPGLAAAIKKLWADEALGAHLANTGFEFAARHCTEETTTVFLLKCLARLSVTTDDAAPTSLTADIPGLQPEVVARGS